MPQDVELGKGFSSVPTLSQVSFFSTWKVLNIAAVHPRFGCSHVLQVRLFWKNLCHHASWWQRAVGVLEIWQTDWPVPLKNASIPGANDPLRDNPRFTGINQIISSKSGSQAFPLQEEQLDRDQSLEKCEREG